MMRLPCFFALLLSTSFLFSCRTAQNYAERGDYDSAINYTVRKLRGKKHKKDEFVRILEVAFKKAQERDMRVAESLINADRPENWSRINEIHRRIEDRQNAVSPLLPLISKSGYRAQFTFVKIEKLENESREKAAEYLYTKAQDLLRRAENSNDRLAAREAFGTLLQLEDRYFQNYKDKEQLKRNARSLGTTHVLFEVKNQSAQILPKSFLDEMLAVGKADLDSEWKSYHFQSEPGMIYDYRVAFNVRNMDFSPERVQERVYTEERDITDGWEYVLDAKGNVLKDTLGNDVKKPRTVRIKAQVFESFQSKAVRLAGRMEVFDSNGSRLNSQDLASEIRFEHYASTFRGDERALSDESRARVGCAPVPFPLNADMMIQAAQRLKPQLRDALRHNGSMN